MDFSSILHLATKNQRATKNKEPAKCLQTKFKPPTKQQRASEKTLSENVRRFLERKQQEELEKKKEAERRKEELIARRSLDPKAHKRIQTMLKRTKSANKSVMEDAVDSNNTADTLAGPSQPDEDDYGFVSETSSQLYNKLIAKMYNTPSDDLPKFAPSKKPTGNLMSTKERVKMALMKQEEEERGPHKRKRRKKDGERDDDNTEESHHDDPPVSHSSTEKKTSKETHKTKKPPQPPPLDFMELLKIAEKKQFEPIPVKAKPKETEPEQLMTKKQKIEQSKIAEERRMREERLKARERGDPPPKNSVGKPEIKRIPKIGQSSNEQRKEERIPKIGQSSNEQKKEERIPKLSTDRKKEDTTSKPVPKPSSSTTTSNRNEVNRSTKPLSNSQSRVKEKVFADGGQKKSLELETDKLKRERDDILRILKEKDEMVKMLEEKERAMRELDEARAKLKKLEEQAKSKLTSQKIPAKSERKDDRTLDVRKDNRPPANGVLRDPKKIVSPQVRQFPPRDVPRIAMKPKERGPMTAEQYRKRAIALRKNRIESEDEYDSEMDDFIDDGPDPTLDGETVSSVISKIFRYDKNKYKQVDDDDDECMESNWAQITKEENYSRRCGLQEDLEDMEMEKRELARKKKAVKKR